MTTNTENQTIGIVLSGGGARGWAHIGVLQALEENGISPQIIAGTSAGAIVGAAYAAGLTPKEMIAIAKDTTMFKLYRGGIRDINIFKPKGLMEMSYLKKILQENLPTDEFQELPKQLFVCVSNIYEGEFEIMNRGSISQAVLASAAFPMMFQPQFINGKAYLDGGLCNNLPIEPLLNTCDKIIGVNVNPHYFDKNVDNMVSITQRCFDITVWQNTKPRLRQCDVIIEPEVYDFGLFELKKAKEICNLGYDYTKTMMPEIRQQLKAETVSS